MRPPSDRDLATELRALRPAPRPAFVAELDARAAAGFPGDSQQSTLSRLLGWRPRPRRLLMASTAGAVAAVALATVLITVAGNGPERLSTEPTPATGRSESSGVANGSGSAGRSQGSAGTKFEASAAGVAVPSIRNGPAVEAENGPYASHAPHREVERDASIVLRTAPADVRSAGAKVYEAVHAVDGIVQRSSIAESGARAGASFELLIPAAKLGDALAAFSEIAEVSSRHESTADVTARTIGLDERLQDSRASVSDLLAQLAAADTDAARAAAEARLRAERNRLASLRSRLSALQRRTHFSRVSLRIVAGESSAGGTWGIGSALADAGHVLEIAAAVFLLCLAILVPVVLLAALAWLGRRRWLRAVRERALG